MHVLDIQLQSEIFTACCAFLKLDWLFEHAVLGGPAVLLLCLVGDMLVVSPQCSSTKSFWLLRGNSFRPQRHLLNISIARSEKQKGLFAITLELVVTAPEINTHYCNCWNTMCILTQRFSDCSGHHLFQHFTISVKSRITVHL